MKPKIQINKSHNALLFLKYCQSASYHFHLGGSAGLLHVVASTLFQSIIPCFVFISNFTYFKEQFLKQP